MINNNIDTDFGFDLLVQMVLHKRTTLPVMVGILRRHFKTHTNGSQMTCDLILKCCQADLVDWHPSLRQLIVRYDISQDVQDDLDRYQYPLPMIVEPNELKTNEDTGYFTSRNSVILKNNHHDNDVCLDHLNKINHIKLKINSVTANMIANSWKNLDKPKDGEDRKDYQRRVKAFEKYDRTAKDVMMHLEIAGNKFYLTHKYDKRGRVYAQGYHVNYQGNAWNKAVIEFAEGEVII
jgi:DNA-directed RNA polymerase